MKEGNWDDKDFKRAFRLVIFDKLTKKPIIGLCFYWNKS